MSESGQQRSRRRLKTPTVMLIAGVGVWCAVVILLSLVGVALPGGVAGAVAAVLVIFAILHQLRPEYQDTDPAPGALSENGDE